MCLPLEIRKFSEGALDFVLIFLWYFPIQILSNATFLFLRVNLFDWRLSIIALLRGGFWIQYLELLFPFVNLRLWVLAIFFITFTPFWIPESFKFHFVRSIWMTACLQASSKLLLCSCESSETNILLDLRAWLFICLFLELIGEVICVNGTDLFRSLASFKKSSVFSIKSSSKLAYQWCPWSSQSPCLHRFISFCIQLQ